MLAEVCARVGAAGVPVSRFLIGYDTLHPLAGGRVYTWRRGEGVECEEIGRAAAEPSAPLLELAARRALEEAFAVGGESVLEPWVSFELWCPESGVTPVLAELSARGGRVDLVSAGRLGARVVGQAPLARMLGFVTKLRSMTKGRGRVSMRPAGMQATK